MKQSTESVLSPKSLAVIAALMGCEFAIANALDASYAIGAEAVVRKLEGLLDKLVVDLKGRLV